MARPTPSEDGWWSSHGSEFSHTPSMAPTPNSFDSGHVDLSMEWRGKEQGNWVDWQDTAGEGYTQTNGGQLVQQTWVGETTARVQRGVKMQTGCVPCLIKGIACDPSNPECKTAISQDWNLNYEDDDNFTPSDTAMSLSLIRPDTKWRKSWRERHSLNFFVNYSAPQMAGFFESAFWQRMVIQTSFHEPAISHAITAIGALHEAILQRTFPDEKRKGQAMEFALSQCNKAITCLTNNARRETVPNNRVALTTCVLFTCFEVLQGRTDSAVNHALQGRRLLEASGRPNPTTMTPTEEDGIEHMRPIVERLEVQATALLDKDKKPDVDTSDRTAPLPPIDRIFSLDHAHDTLHTAMNSIMRFMQGFHPTAPRDHIAVTMAEKYLRYSPWFQQWEQAFTVFLTERRETLTDMDLKRAMVLKCNHLVSIMLASVDQSAGPEAYDPYEAEFRAIVELSREVLSTLSCPPNPSLSSDNNGSPFLSLSLWVTDPLWMAISRCRNSSIRQSAFILLSQNPRMEGIWHSGPVSDNKKGNREGKRGRKPRNTARPSDEDYETPEEVARSPPAGNMRLRAEWVDLRANLHSYSERGGESNASASSTTAAASAGPAVKQETTPPAPPRYSGHCNGRCSIPTLSELNQEMEDVSDVG